MNNGFFGQQDQLDDAAMKRILSENRRVTVVGASDNPLRPSYDIMTYLVRRGFDIVPVNPNHDNILGMECMPSLLDVKGGVGIVNIFRRPEHLVPIVDDAITADATCVWMQLGVVNQDAFEMSVCAGIDTIMNRCIKIEYRRLIELAL